MSKDAVSSLGTREKAREVIKRALEEHQLSMRSLAAAIGLKTHSSLSACFLGKGSLSTYVLVKICELLTLSNEDYFTVLVSSLPNEVVEKLRIFPMFKAMMDGYANRQTSIASKLIQDGEWNPNDINPKIPWVFEVVKGLGSGTVDSVFGTFPGFLKVSIVDIEICLEQLAT